MDIYDTANKLAKEIKESREYREYKTIKKNIDSDTTRKNKVERFEKLRYKIQLKQINGDVSQLEDEKKKLEETYMNLLEDDEIKQYFEKEMKFNVMIADINKIIAEAVRDII